MYGSFGNAGGQPIPNDVLRRVMEADKPSNQAQSATVHAVRQSAAPRTSQLGAVQPVRTAGAGGRTGTNVSAAGFSNEASSSVLRQVMQADRYESASASAGRTSYPGGAGGAAARGSYSNQGSTTGQLSGAYPAPVSSQAQFQTGSAFSAVRQTGQSAQAQALSTTARTPFPPTRFNQS
ncbi:hypothetical protein LLE49_07215 [Alicyclobacillus tolerans]|uniref:hypothetical protein n=1 Tax=Alicyclobacillus tolerans TaxID=90970 RepID=UPI001F449E94|nr:hypothetical protein [Alicyclobacillus tolerans]MCF8564533.1 hypothetical protein [Alicyclobacillus tolerans]